MTIIVIGIAIVMVLSWLIGRRWRERVAAAAVLGAALGVYGVLGAPLRPGQPLSARIAVLSERDPASLAPDELIAVRRALMRQSPTDRAHRLELAEALASAGQLDEAGALYRAALRMEPTNGPALRGLADVVTLSQNGWVGEQAITLYRGALAVDPGDTRAGFMLGLGLWSAGEHDQARARWEMTRAALRTDDPIRARLLLLQQRIESEGPLPATE